MFTSFLIKYAEIGIKGKNRYLFEDALVRQIKYALKKCEGEFLVHKTQGVFHQRQRFRADRIRPCRRTDPFPDGLTEVPLCFIFLPG